MAATQENEVLGTNFGSDAFPVEWEEGEKELFWIHDDLHIPNPVSPLFFDIGGWWLTCDHMFRRFGTPFAVDWLAKNVNGYLYTAAIPADPSLTVGATEYGNRYSAREKIFDAVIDKVDVKTLGELSPREIEHDNPEIRRTDEMASFLGQLYNREVEPDALVTVIRFSQIMTGPVVPGFRENEIF